MNQATPTRRLFCLDTNVFVESWARRYPIDVFPSFWRRLENWAEKKVVLAPIEVRNELQKIEDELFHWVKDRPFIFRDVDEKVQLKLAEIMAKFPRLVDTKKGRNVADPWVIAQAQSESAIVITEELPGGGKSPKIPDVCEALSIPYANTLQLIREMKLSF